MLEKRWCDMVPIFGPASPKYSFLYQLQKNLQVSKNIISYVNNPRFKKQIFCKYTSKQGQCFSSSTCIDLHWEPRILLTLLCLKQRRPEERKKEGNQRAIKEIIKKKKKIKHKSKPKPNKSERKAEVNKTRKSEKNRKKKEKQNEAKGTTEKQKSGTGLGSSVKKNGTNGKKGKQRREQHRTVRTKP